MASPVVNGGWQQVCNERCGWCVDDSAFQKVHIQSAGPVTVHGSTIILEAGAPGKGSTAFTGEIMMRAKNITLEAEELVRVNSKTQDIELVAKEVLAFQGREVQGKATEQLQLDGGSKLTADSADSNYL